MQPCKPSTYKELEQFVPIDKTHMQRLVAGNAELYKAICDNKSYHRCNEIREAMARIERIAAAKGVSPSRASEMAGHNQSYYAQLKGRLRQWAN